MANYGEERIMKEFLHRVIDQDGMTVAMLWMCFSCAILLVMPTALLPMGNATVLSNTLSPYLFILAMVAGAYLVARSLTFLFTCLRKYYDAQNLCACRNKMIRQLDFEEKALLREFIIQRKTVLSLPLNEPAVNNLLASGVLSPAYETQEIKGSNRIIKLSIAIEAREQLTHKVIGLPVGKLTEEEAELLKAARPEYARSNYIPL